MTRPSMNEILMTMAETLASRSTCTRANVGAILATDGRCIAMGYNGAPSGLPHCDHEFELEAVSPLGPIGFLNGCTISVHAEANTIAFAAKNGIRTEGSEMYTTHWPCLNCAKLIINAGVTKVYYRNAYRITEGVDLLAQVGIPVVMLDKP